MSDPDDTVEDQIRRVQERLHIVDGLVRALEDPHALLDVLLQADDVVSAHRAVQETFSLEAIQAHAVMDLQLRRMPRRDLQRIVGERDELAAALARLRSPSA